ncbi:hypothetical protein ACFL5O_03695 [Myxococcota bacterium]
MRLFWVAPVAVFIAAFSFSAPHAAAQEAKEDKVSPTGKGIVGGTLLGGEVVMLVEAALSVKPTWAYIVGGLAGGIGGGVGGYYAEQEASSKASLYLLAGGMALVIPTTVAVLSASAYRPPADYTQDQGPSDEPLAEPPQPIPPASIQPDSPAVPGAPTQPAVLRKGPVRERVAALRIQTPPALLDLRQGALTLGVPAVEVRETFTRKERAMYGVGRTTLVSVPVMSGCF